MQKNRLEISAANLEKTERVCCRSLGAADVAEEGSPEQKVVVCVNKIDCSDICYPLAAIFFLFIFSDKDYLTVTRALS